MGWPDTPIEGVSPPQHFNVVSRKITDIGDRTMGIGDGPKFFADKPLGDNFLVKFREAFKQTVFHPIEIREKESSIGGTPAPDGVRGERADHIVTGD